MTTFPYSKWVEIQVFGTFCDIVFDNITDFAIIQLLNKHMTQLSALRPPDSCLQPEPRKQI